MYLPDLFAVLPDDRSERWRRLATFIEGWWSALTPEDGTPEHDLRDAEARIGVALPAALREAYARFGRRREIAESFDTMVRAWFLQRPDGILIVWFCNEIEWFIRERDLALPDPPLIMRRLIGHDWVEYPALPHDPPISRFFLWKALEQATFGSRYGNVAGALGDVEPLAAEVARRFPLLDFGTVEHPLPSTRLYGGEDVLIAVMAGAEVKVTVSAPNLAGYRRAMDALHDLALPWKNTTDAEAYRGEFHEQWPGPAAGTRGRAEAVKASLRGERDPGPAPPNDSAAGSASDLDPRVAVYVDAAVRPYERLLPWLCIRHLHAALELAIETASPLEACANVLVGKPSTDDVVMPPLEPLPPETEAAMQAIGVSPEARAWLDAVRGSGLIDKFIGAVVRRYARTTLDRALTRREERDEDLMSEAETCLKNLVYELPAEPVPDRAAAEAALSRTLRRLAASMFAGIAGVLGVLPSDIRYLRASIAFDMMPSSEEDLRLFQTYYVARQTLGDTAKQLGVPIAVEVERQCAYLDGVASAVEAAIDDNRRVMDLEGSEDEGAGVE